MGVGCTLDNILHLHRALSLQQLSFFEFDDGNRREHSKKLFRRSGRLNSRKSVFGKSRMDYWNGFSDSCINCPMIKYDFKSEINVELEPQMQFQHAVVDVLQCMIQLYRCAQFHLFMLTSIRPSLLHFPHLSPLHSFTLNSKLTSLVNHFPHRSLTIDISD